MKITTSGWTLISSVLVVVVVICCGQSTQTRYEPTWESLDSRPVPEWYDKAKIGIFIHWGVFSVPSYVDEWFWDWWLVKKNKQIDNYMTSFYKPNFTYAEFAPKFTAEFFDAYQWAELFNKSGARYVVLTTKHHEGFTLWPSKFSFNWNAMDVGPKRDLVGELAKEVRSRGLHYGLHYGVWYTRNPKNSNQVYASVLEYSDTVEFGAIPYESVESIRLLGSDQKITYGKNVDTNDTMMVFPSIAPNSPLKYAYVFEFKLHA